MEVKDLLYTKNTKALIKNKTKKKADDTNKWKNGPCGKILLKCPYYMKKSIETMQSP